MISLDDELAIRYLDECREHLATMETSLLAVEKGAEIDEDCINRAFRAVHSIKGGAGFFDLEKIRELARQTEGVLALIRSRAMVPTPDRAGVLLRATGRLRGLIQNPGPSNQADIGEILTALAGLSADQQVPVGKGHDSAGGLAQPPGKRLRALVVEDDFSSRLLLQTLLSRYGECHIAVNGREAVNAIRAGLEKGTVYDLICMDIMMPEMDGCEAVRQVRAMEHEHGISLSSGAKIIMTTAVTDIKEVIRCFRELCDSYLMKPIDLNELLSQMKSYQLVR